MTTQKQSLEIMRHSSAHLLAAAIMELYPDTKLGIGPVVEHGFYYDVALPKQLGEHDLAKIEKRMQAIQKRNLAFRREEMSLEKAIAFFKEQGQDLKVSLLEDLKKRGTTSVREEDSQDLDEKKPSKISVYWTGKFVDLCRGPHVASTKEIGEFKLTKVAGAYWRGDEKNQQLTRIYGVAFAEATELADYLKMMKEADRRDHRKLGQELDLFYFSDLVGAGLPLFTARGTFLRNKITDFVLELQEPLGYSRVHIPHIAKSDLYKISGHWDKFEDDLFHVRSKKTDAEFVLKPMNCPHHTQIYSGRPRSYRDLPISTSEVTAVYRDENTGQLQGLSRVRSISQDDLHVFCRPDQIKDEIKKMYSVVKKFYRVFKMPLEVHLSTHDPKRMKDHLGDEKIWEKNEDTLLGVIKEIGDTCVVDSGEAAFYGPKIDFVAKDAIGRNWQLATIQLDSNLPERFNLVYADKDGEEKRPVMLHRAILGAVERFMAILIEHYAGAFPVWLAPTQVAIVPVARAHTKPSEVVARIFREQGIRVSVDDANETVGKKIRNAEKQKVPYMLVIGDKEAKNLSAKTFGARKFAVRVRGKKDMVDMIGKKFLERVLTDIKKKR